MAVPGLRRPQRRGDRAVRSTVTVSSGISVDQATSPDNTAEVALEPSDTPDRVTPLFCGVSWRVSGRDGWSHAFAAFGDYVPSHNRLVVLGNLASGDYYVHDVELFHSMCGHPVPTAALMPHDQADTCTHCWNQLADRTTS